MQWDFEGVLRSTLPPDRGTSSHLDPSYLRCCMLGPLQWTDYDERVLPSIVNEVTKAVVAKYNASELLTKREVRNYWVDRSVKRSVQDCGSVRFGGLVMC